jgi:hypothetical protein
MAKSWRCYVGLHRWVEKVREGKKYGVCRDCGRERFLDTFDPPPFGI